MRRRPLKLSEFYVLAKFYAFSDDRIAAITKRVTDGEKLEIEESSFSDAGSDYSTIFLGGNQIERMEGY